MNLIPFDPLQFTSYSVLLTVCNSPLHFQDLKSVHDTLKSIFLIFPNYCLGRGLMDIAFNEYMNEFYSQSGNSFALSPS